MLIFSNPGALDLAALTTFGVNAKPNSTAAIGTFGTGLKYAIAVTLRLGGTITIRTQTADQTAPDVITFGTEEHTIRNAQFNLITMAIKRSDEETPQRSTLAFTTALGKNWEPWMAYRELRSNMVDEGGAFGPHDAPGPYTEICVECPAIEAAHTTGQSYFIETEPLWRNDDLEVHPARDDGAIFYRGIRVAQYSALSSAYTYNILHEERLTEDRTLDLWSAQYRITQSIAHCDNAEIAETILLAPREAWEHGFAFDYITDFSPEMREAIREAQHKAELNVSARQRAKTLYIDDYLPDPIPMTEAQHDWANAILDLLQSVNIPHKWTRIRAAMPLSDFNDALVHGDTLYLAAPLWDTRQGLLEILQRRFEGLPWQSFRAENQLITLMRQIKPDHYLLSQDPEAEEEIPF